MNNRAVTFAISFFFSFQARTIYLFIYSFLKLQIKIVAPPPPPLKLRLPLRNLGSSSGSDKSSRMYTFDFAEDDPVYRPPPRGGRYKRALTDLQTPQGQQLQGVYFPSLVADAEPRQRSMALPRIGRYTQENLLDMRTKAVPHPRIGRVPTSGTGSRKSAAADSDPMADPRQV